MLINRVQTKRQEVIAHMNACKNVFRGLINLGLPSPWDGHEDIYNLEDYKDMLHRARDDDSFLADIEGPVRALLCPRHQRNSSYYGT